MNLDTTETRQGSQSATVFYVSPQDVLDDASMALDEKRALLASWASDARAVIDAPALRQLDNGAIVLIDDILDALKQLDGTGSPAPKPADRSARWSRKRSGRALSPRSSWWRREDDDDDPPPCPVSARHPRPSPILDGAYAA